jgi:hypothetical protein
MESLEVMIAKNARLNEKVDNLTHIITQLLANSQIMPIPKPELTRQTNEVPYGCHTPPPYPKARLWPETPEEFMEVDDNFLAEPKM